MRYGVPYKGSKNSIAEWVYSHFPKADNFYDLFAGGCAITQVALMRQEYKNYFCNDIDGGGIELFLNAIYGKYKNENRWIDRATFFKEKDKDPYIKYCWSFGNNGRDYLYSQEIEPFKKAWHYAIYFNDFSLAEELGLNLKPIENIQGIYERYIETFYPKIVGFIEMDIICGNHRCSAWCGRSIFCQKYHICDRASYK